MKSDRLGNSLHALALTIARQERDADAVQMAVVAPRLPPHTEPFKHLRTRFQTICNARIETVGKPQSCMRSHHQMLALRRVVRPQRADVRLDLQQAGAGDSARAAVWVRVQLIGHL